MVEHLISFIIDSCLPKDSDICLQNSHGWDSSYNCANSIKYCSSYAKDLRRCCPDSCQTGQFSEEECKNVNSHGFCIYPNEAQCESNGMICNIFITTFWYNHSQNRVIIPFILIYL